MAILKNSNVRLSHFTLFVQRMSAARSCSEGAVALVEHASHWDPLYQAKTLAATIAALRSQRFDRPGDPAGAARGGKDCGGEEAADDQPLPRLYFFFFLFEEQKRHRFLCSCCLATVKPP